MYTYLVIILVIIIVINYKKNYNYWSIRNVRNDVPLPIIGNMLSVIFGIQTLSEFCNKLYNKYPNEKIIGYYRGTEPVLIVCDPDLLKHVLTIDFIQFHKRGLGGQADSEPLLRNVFFIDGDHWQILRRAISPAFTRSKLRSMFSSIEPNILKLQLLAYEYASRGETIEAYDLMARYIIESIGITSFNVEINTIHTKKSHVLDLGKAFFRETIYQKLFYVIRDILPNKYSNSTIPGRFIRQIFSTGKDLNTTYKTGSYFGMMMELRQKGKLNGLSLDQIDENGELKKVELQVDDSCISAQLFMQFAGTFETSSCAASYALHELAHHPKWQEEVQKNIDTVLAKYDNKICYDAISEMKLLSMVVKESLRIFPPAGITTRICTKDYKVTGTNIVIPKGMRILIPIQAIHMDPRYYDDPDQFQPERFSPENMKQRRDYTYLPFGEGPRKCIGAEQGMMLLKTGLVAILQKYTVEPASPRKYTIDKLSYLVQIIKGGLPVKLKPRLLPNNSRNTFQNEIISFEIDGEI